MIHAAATSPDGSLLAAESNSTIRLWSLRKRQPVGAKICGHTHGITDVRFSPNGKLPASGAWDGAARIWQIPSGRLLLVLNADVHRVSSVAFLPDGSLVTAIGMARCISGSCPSILLGSDWDLYSGASDGCAQEATVPEETGNTYFLTPESRERVVAAYPNSRLRDELK